MYDLKELRHVNIPIIYMLSLVNGVTCTQFTLLFVGIYQVEFNGVEG